MGIFNSYIFGKLRKSVGNVTTYELNGQQVARGKVVFKHDPKTPAQLEQRARMKMVRRLAREMTPAVREGFPGATLGEKYNRFVQRNIGLLGVDEQGNMGFDPEQLQLSSGETTAPDVSASVDREAGVVVFTQQAQPLRPSMPDDDRVFGAVLPLDGKDFVKVFPLLLRGESGTTEIALPEGMKGARLAVYAFTMGANGKKAGQTVCCLVE